VDRGHEFVKTTVERNFPLSALLMEKSMTSAPNPIAMSLGESLRIFHWFMRGWVTSQVICVRPQQNWDPRVCLVCPSWIAHRFHHSLDKSILYLMIYFVSRGCDRIPMRPQDLSLFETDSAQH
jgi:hypothetical protein